MTEADGGEVNVYYHRHYDTDRKLFQVFTEETGVAVNVVEAGADELIQRLLAEGDQADADLLITADAARLHRAKEEGLLQPVESEVISDRLPGHLQDTDGQWFALTERARVIAYHYERSAHRATSTTSPS